MTVVAGSRAARSERRRVGDRHRGGQVAAALPQPGRVVAPRLCRLRRTRGGSGLIDGPRPTPPKQHARPGRAGPSLPEFQIALPWAALMGYGAGIQLGSTSAASCGRSALIAIIVTVFAGTRGAVGVGDDAGDADIAIGRGNRIADRLGVIRAGPLDRIGDEADGVVAERGEGDLRIGAVSGLVVPAAAVRPHPRL